MTSQLKQLTYHDLHITTPEIPRVSIFDLPYRVIVQCTRCGGWAVWARSERGLQEENLGKNGFILDVDGVIIFDSINNTDSF